MEVFIYLWITGWLMSLNTSYLLPVHMWTTGNPKTFFVTEMSDFIGGIGVVPSKVYIRGDFSIVIHITKDEWSG